MTDTVSLLSHATQNNCQLRCGALLSVPLHQKYRGNFLPGSIGWCEVGGLLPVLLLLVLIFANSTHPAGRAQVSITKAPVCFGPNVCYAFQGERTEQKISAHPTTWRFPADLGGKFRPDSILLYGGCTSKPHSHTSLIPTPDPSHKSIKRR